MKTIFFFFCLLFFSNKIIAQNKIQEFLQSGFKVNCGCELKENTIFIAAAKQNGINNILAAYICGENSDDPNTGVANNINISDISSNYIKINPSFYGYFEKKSLEAYAKNLQNVGIVYNYISFNGISALEYTFDQMDLPTKALFFIKNKKTYLIQAGTRKNLQLKYSLLKNSFKII